MSSVIKLTASALKIWYIKQIYIGLRAGFPMMARIAAQQSRRSL